MFQISRYIHPGYMSHHLRREIKEMYWAKAIADFALAAVMLFEPIFLYTVLDFSIQQVLWFFIAVYAIYLPLMPLGAKLAARRGYEHSILYSSFFMVLYWALLFSSQEVTFWIYLAPLALAIQKCLYWPAFNADMARFSSADQRGRENSGLYALIAVVFIVAPLAGGFILSEFGFAALFIMVTVLTLLSNVPLFTTLEQFVPKNYHYRDTLLMYKEFPRQALGYIGFGEEAVQLILWPLFIFLTVPDFFKFGSIISFSTLIATLVMLYVGILTDQRGKGVLIRIFSLALSLFWFIRPYFPTLTGIMATNTLGTIAKNSFIVPVTTLTYDRANETHIMPHVVFFEQNLVIGKLLIMFLILISLSFTASFTPIFVMAGLFSLLFTFLR
jgi:MFS family permease